jgi:hypothetical protein
MTTHHINGYNKDIITAIHAMVPAAVEETKQLSKYMCGDTAKNTARNIYNFLADNVTYIKDTDNEQIIKLPAALVANGGDCKSFALFAVSCLLNCALPAYFRFASYEPSDKTPTHVYAFTKDSAGREIIIDPVYGVFNSEKSYCFKKDKNMKISSMAGVNDRQIFGVYELTAMRSDALNTGNFNKFVPYTAEEMEIYMSDGSSIGHDGKGKHKLKNLALSPARNAFLGLVDLNVHHFASKIKAWNDRNPGEVKTVWERDLGGSYNKLMNAVNRGAHKKALLGVETNANGIGFAVAAAIAAAAPIIAIIAKHLNLSPDELTDIHTTTDDITEVADAHMQPPLPPVMHFTPNKQNLVTAAAGIAVTGLAIVLISKMFK